MKELFRYIFCFGFVADFKAGQQAYVEDFLAFHSEMMKQNFVNQMKRIQDEEDRQQLDD